jgi:GrpB-like predicted nucleotidyltransferase (UPF0157 family)
MTLGLMRGVVRLAEHDSTWADEFRHERCRLSAALSDTCCEIEHIGSTAVRGMRAKPILDIALGYAVSTKLEELAGALERLRYEYRGDSGDKGGHVFVRGTGDRRTHHLHAVLLYGAQWSAYLTLRDLLRSDARARAFYSSAKDGLALQFENDRRSYTDGKTAIIQRLLGGSY